MAELKPCEECRYFKDCSVHMTDSVWDRAYERRQGRDCWTSAELRECPFCGGTATVFRQGNSYRQWHILCECGGRVGFFLTEQEAIEVWNRRVGDG